MRLTLIIVVLASWALAPSARAQSKVDAERAALMLVFDGSGSMWGNLEGSKAPKFELALQALRKVLVRVPPTLRTGVAGFGAGTRGCSQAGVLAAPAAHDAERVLSPLAQWNPRGKGPLVAGVRAAAEPFAAGKQTVSIVVVYDGVDNCQQDLCSATRELKAANPGLRIHLVGLGLKPGEQQAMACAARLTGGSSFNATTAALVEKTIEQAVTAAGLQAPPQPVSGPDVSSPRVNAMQVLGGPGLLGTLSLGQDGPVVDIPVAWRVVATGAASEGAAAQRMVSGSIGPQLQVRLGAGRYRIEANAAGLTASADVDLAEGEAKNVVLPVTAGLLDFEATVGGSLPLSSQASVTIRREDGQDGAGIDGRRVALGDLSAVLKPGRYRIAVRDGLLNASQAVDVRAGRTSEVAMDLPGGRLKLLVEAGGEATPADLARLKLVLLEDDPSGQSARRELTRTTASSADWSLPAGTYYIVTDIGYGDTVERVTVTPGEVTTARISVYLRRIRLTAQVPPQIVAPDAAFRWRILPAGPVDAVPAVYSGRSVEVALVPGRYRFESKIGGQNAIAVRDIVIGPNSEQAITVTHTAGVLALEATQAGPGTLHWEVFDTSGARVWSGGARAPQLFLQEGTYSVKLFTGNTVSERPVEVARGERRSATFGRQ